MNEVPKRFHLQLNDAITLIRSDAISRAQRTCWADLGAGAGLFTRALASKLAPGSTIYAVDKERPVIASDMGGIIVEAMALDFVTDPFPFTQLDGILMANALHYVRDKQPFLQKIMDSICDSGVLLLVEYDTDKAVPKWVPYPVGFQSLNALLAGYGFTDIRRLGTYPSAFGGRMYSAVAAVSGLHRQ